MRPILNIPNRMITTPAIFVRMDIFEVKKAPIIVAEAPRRTKTNENPVIKKIELSMIGLFSPLPSISSEDIPDRNDMYPGTMGRMHGDMNEIKPAIKAMYIETSGIVIDPFHFLFSWKEAVRGSSGSPISRSVSHFRRLKMDWRNAGLTKKR